MGNTQSTPPAEPPMKITKPMTNRSSTNLALRLPAQQSTVSLSTPGKASSSTSGEDIVTSTAGDARSRKDARQRLRTHLLSLANLAAHNGEDDSGNSPASSGTPPRDRLSRSGSLVSHVSSNRGSTTRLSSMWDSRLTLVAESSVNDAGMNARPLEALEETDPAEEAPRFVRRSSTWEPQRPELERQGLLALRRRSMFTPGVATRGKLSRNRSTDRLSSLVAEAGTRQSIDLSSRPPTMPASTPSPMLAPTPLSPGVRFAASEDRALTPSDQDYAHLGCFMRGSLHVTNGPASPVPSTINSIRPPAAQGDVASIRDGYFAIPPASTVGQRSMLGSNVQLSSDLPPPSPTELFEMGPSSPKEHPDGRERSDPSQFDWAQSEETGEMEYLEAVTSMTEGPVELPSNIMHEYLAELPANPYHLETLQPVADHLMDTPEKIKYIPYRPMVVDEGVVTSPRQSSDRLEGRWAEESPSSRLDRAPNRRLEGPADDWPLKRAATEPASTAFTKSFAQRDPRHRASRHDSSELLAKTDSGYSSDISLQSVHELPAADVEREGRPVPSRRASFIHAPEAQESLRRPMVPQKAPPPVPAKMTTPSPRWSMDSTGNPPVPPKTGGSYQAKRMSLHMGDAVDPAVVQAPQLPPKDTWWPLGGMGSSKSTRGRSPGRKLQKPMPASVARKSAIISQADGHELPEIPPVPSETATRSSEQLDAMPSMEPMLARSKTSPDTGGHARPKSIVADVTLQPDVEEAKARRTTDGTSRRRRSSIGAVLPALRRKLSSVSGGLLAVDSTALTVDHDTALDSLGGSPYDAAIAASGGSRRRSQEMSRRVHKTKSMVEMSSRSSDSSNNVHAREEKRASSTSRVSGRPRPHSFHSSESVQQIDRSKKPRRPKSVVVRDAPPVPSLPAIHLQELESGSSSNLLAPPKPPKKEAGMKTNSGRSIGTSGRSWKLREDLSLPARSAVKRHQESLSRPTMSLSGTSSRKATRGSTSGSTSTSTFTRLQQTHGLDLRDVPISVPV